jgi:hypothetical protein
MNIKTVVLEREKETKATIRYQEIDGGEDLRMVYVPKPTLAQLGNPDRLEITLAAA